MTSDLAFRPDWASAPGDTISDILQERGLSVRDFAHDIGQTMDEVDGLLDGRASITLGVARNLTDVLGASIEFWMSRDYQYREDMAKLQETDERWLDDLPISEMIRFGWLEPAPLPADELGACLRFFDVPNISSWHEKYSAVEAMAAFRTSPAFDSHPGALAAWLRQGEIAAAAIDCRPWDNKRFEVALEKVRPLTRKKDPAFFLPALQAHCADGGVAVVVVRAPTGCRASGATRFLPGNKGLLQLSFRYLTDDHFWFTFFHEAGHLLLHGKERIFLEEGEPDITTEEHEANAFAADFLVPPTYQQELLGLPPRARSVIAFARRVGVSPGIIVGQLQHKGKLPYNWLNKLKRRYSWEN